MTDMVLQWHPGFCAALQIELQEESGNLEFYPEYELSKKPMRKDTLIVKKMTDSSVRKNIGRIFRKHNICMPPLSLQSDTSFEERKKL